MIYILYAHEYFLHGDHKSPKICTSVLALATRPSWSRSQGDLPQGPFFQISRCHVCSPADKKHTWWISHWLNLWYGECPIFSWWISHARKPGGDASETSQVSPLSWSGSTHKSDADHASPPSPPWCHRWMTWQSTRPTHTATARRCLQPTSICLSLGIIMPNMVEHVVEVGNAWTSRPNSAIRFSINTAIIHAKERCWHLF